MATPRDFKDKFYPAQQAMIVSQETLDERLRWADEHSSDDETAKKFEVGYTYLAAADYLKKTNAFKLAARNYHFAGHQMRAVDNLKNAAEAYFNGGVAAELGADGAAKAEELKWAVRSYARAMVCYSDVGETDEASKAYVAQQEARRKLAQAEGKSYAAAFLGLLRATSGYGQSATRLAQAAAWAMFAYGAAYALIVGLNFGGAGDALAEEIKPWRWWSGWYYAVAISVSFDPAALATKAWLVKWIALSNVVAAWFLLGVGAALVARRVKER